MKNLILTLVAVLITISINAQTTFQKTYGGTAMDEAKSVKQTFDGGYIIVGTTTSFGAGGRDVLVIKTNAVGDTLWTKTLGGAIDNEYGYCVQQTLDSGYIVSGVAFSFNDVSGDVYVVKLAANGDIVWTRTYGGLGYEWGAYIQQTSDGGYIIAGQTPAFGAGGFDAYLIKIHANGDLLWAKTYGGSGLEIGSAVQQTTDGGYILTGQVDTYGAGSGDFYLLKTDAAGNAIWSKAYGLSGTEAGIAVRQTTDGGYIIAGTSENALGPLGADMCLIKTDVLGEILWAKLYGGTLIDECYDVIQTEDGGYAMCGKSFSFSTSGDYDVYMVKVNAQGIMQWSKTFGDSGNATKNEIGNSIFQTTDKGYIIGGEAMFSFGVGLKNAYLIKTDSLGVSGCYEGNPNTITSTLLPQQNSFTSLVATGGVMNTPNTIVGNGTTPSNLCINIVNAIQEVPISQVQTYPNPVGDNLHLRFNAISNQTKVVEVFDSTGKLLISQKTISNLLINTENLSRGIYFIKITEENTTQSIKFIKQ
jgi:hypothetical protein